MTTTTLSPKREQWLLLTLAGIQFTNILDFMIMMPLGPQLTQLFGITDAQFGLLVSAYTLASGVSGLIAATYVDRFDRKKLLLVLYFCFALATLACGYASSYVLLMLARVAAGVFGGVLTSLWQTIVGDVIPFERRGRAMGIVMTALALASVAGVPLGLFLTTHFGWHAPYRAIGSLAFIFFGVACVTLPSLRQHLSLQRPAVIDGIRQVIKEPNHLKAFLFSGLMMMTGFTVLPYITIYMQANVKLLASQIPYIYLCGGAATLFTARLFGRMADQYGKIKIFRLMSLLIIVPMFAITLWPVTPAWAVLPVSTVLFILMSGRMIPGMAIVTSAADPALRGTFMTLNSSIQSLFMGISAFIGGVLISRNALGEVTFYWHAAVVAACASLAAAALAKRIRIS